MRLFAPALLPALRLLLREARRWLRFLNSLRRYRVCLGIDPRKAPPRSIILFPFQPGLLSCGLAGIVTVKKGTAEGGGDPGETLIERFRDMKGKGLSDVIAGRIGPEAYLAPREVLEDMGRAVMQMKEDGIFEGVFRQADRRRRLDRLSKEMNALILREDKLLEEGADHFSTDDLEKINSRLILMKDVCWSLEKDILDNIPKIEDLLGAEDASGEAFRIYAHLNYLLNCLDRIEVRGRDSAGIQVTFSFKDRQGLAEALQALRKNGLHEDFARRAAAGDLTNGSLHLSCPASPEGKIFLTFTYKTASVIGELGRNVKELRRIIREDGIFHHLVRCEALPSLSLAHTRWASVGSITEENCHPVNSFTLADATDAAPSLPPGGMCGLPLSPEILDLLTIPRVRKHYPRYGEGDWSINVVLNGDVDNYPTLRNAAEAGDRPLIAPELTTDTKIIPLEIEKYLLAGQDLVEAFRLAVNDFEGSHAIAMTSDLEPGKAFLAIKGSGQSIYVGLCEDKYLFSSELYGLVEGTPRFIKMDGESDAGPGHPEGRGQIFILGETSRGGLAGIRGLFYDGTPLRLSADDVKLAEITTRDIDRESFPHFFLKEISESSRSVRKTLRGKYRISGDGKVAFNLGDDILPADMRKALVEKKIRNIVIVGHGTAAVAGMAVADGFSRYLQGRSLTVKAKKASELSGFALVDDLSDTLVIPITQSGTTTDTNRAVAMAVERGASVIAIVNRRQSDITHKSQGVFYTSDGRDIEMSVASTKAFYSQIVAGHLLALCIARLLGLGDEVIAGELKALERAPGLMNRVLEKAGEIKDSAWKLAGRKKFWAVVGSGPNKAAADEIRIKLSELCYKTISSDIVEDKKHIDLSAEPLIIVCAAGNPEAVIADIIKDVAIFKAHRAAVVVFADEGEHRFDDIADSVITLPAGPVPLPVILNTMAGHLWGYYAACSIDEEAAFFQEFRNHLSVEMVQQAKKDLSIYEKMADKGLHLVLDSFFRTFNDRRNRGAFSLTSVKTVSDIALLVKYASGKLPLEDYWAEFNGDNTANPIDRLNVSLGHAVDELSRPIDAIRHQAKTVTVGTSRKEEPLRGPLFDLLRELRFSARALKGQHILALSRIQRAVSGIKGYTLYDVNNLDEEGNPLDTSTITIRERGGISLQMTSRVEASKKLMGTKRTIVRTASIFAGFGKSDGAAITLIPLLGEKPGVRNLLLVHVAFNETLSAREKIAVLGDRYNDIRNLINEYNLPWDDGYLERMPIGILLGESVEFIAAKIKKNLEET